MGYISVSTINLLGPGQHWENQQFKKRHLEKLESESKTKNGVRENDWTLRQYVNVV